MTFTITSQIERLGGPSLPRMAANAARSLVTTISHAATGGGLFADQDTLSKRALACALCDSHEIVNGMERCLDHHCGCFLKAKRPLKHMRCPRGFW